MRPTGSLPMSSTVPPPMMPALWSRSLGQALTALTLEHEGEAKVSLPMGANVIRVLDGDTVRIRDLPQLSGVSKEAVEMAVNFLARKRLAAVEPQRSVRLSPLGLEALAGYRTRAARPENAALRASLEAIVSQRGAVGGWVGPARWLLAGGEAIPRSHAAPAC